MNLMPTALHLLIALPVLFAASSAIGQIDIEEAPISYSDTVDNNSVTALIERYNNADVVLDYHRGYGYLTSLLKELDIDASSQVLVFSKTSLQVRHISPRNPRAIYFNDDTYVGWVRGSDLMEISTSDARLGAAFYKATMNPSAVAFRRANYECLGCHATSMTNGVPGHTVRSVYASRSGEVDPKRISFISTHKSPLSERWGGWYVTGLHGDMEHMGNAFLRGSEFDRTNSSNLKNLRDYIQTIAFLASGSDIVSLMVLEHQTAMHNSFNVANFKVRIAKHDFETASKQSKEDSAELQVIVSNAADVVVKDLLFVDEAKLDSEIKGSVLFQKQFIRRGPFDNDERSLRQFDLKTRLFRYPCSYMVYSRAFKTLEPDLRNAIYDRLKSILLSPNVEVGYQHLTDDDRTAIAEILMQTRPELANRWNSGLDSVD